MRKIAAASAVLVALGSVAASEDDPAFERAVLERCKAETLSAQWRMVAAGLKHPDPKVRFAYKFVGDGLADPTKTNAAMQVKDFTTCVGKMVDLVIRAEDLEREAGLKPWRP